MKCNICGGVIEIVVVMGNLIKVCTHCHKRVCVN